MENRRGARAAEAMTQKTWTLIQTMRWAGMKTRNGIDGEY